MRNLNVVGCGDLGGSLINEGLRRGERVSFYDTNTGRIEEFMDGFRATVHPNELIATGLHTSNRLTLCRSEAELFEEKRRGPIHFATPAQAVLHYAGLSLKDVGFMHDSVMESSREVWEELEASNAFQGTSENLSIVHFLMNGARKVILAPDYGDVKRAQQHLEDFGMTVEQLDVDTHDTMMAGTQGLMLQLMLDYALDLRLLNQKGLMQESGLLTNLHNVLDGRFATWTDETLRSVAGNRKLEITAGAVEAFIENRKKIRRTPEGSSGPDMEVMLDKSLVANDMEEMEDAFMETCVSSREALIEHHANDRLTPSGETVFDLVTSSLALVGSGR